MSKKIITVVGARPQFIKAAVLGRAIANMPGRPLNEVLVHTGQHYDAGMSNIFFDELQIQKPAYNLGVGSGLHGAQTALMIDALEKVFMTEKPHCVVVFGDTNSTLAAALAASKLHIPIAHVEAGMRSFNKKMPEETNRILTDHLSTFLFCASQNAIQNLQHEGFNTSRNSQYTADSPCIMFTGDIMFDAAIQYYAGKSATDTNPPFANSGKEYVVATLHRDFNTDNAAQLKIIFAAFATIANKYGLDFFIPLHPRTKKMMDLHKVAAPVPLKIIDAQSYISTLQLLKGARMVMTDSGGMQKESYYFKKPCIVLREQTEWVELVENGNNILSSQNVDQIVSAFDTLFHKNDYTFPSFYGEGNSASIMVQQLATL